MTTIDLLSKDGFIMMNKAVGREYGNSTSIVLGAICSVYDYWRKNGGIAKDGSFYYTVDDMERDTNLTKNTQRTHLQKLADLGWITFWNDNEKFRHIKINEKALDDGIRSIDVVGQKLCEGGSEIDRGSHKNSAKVGQKLCINNKDNNKDNKNEEKEGFHKVVKVESELGKTLVESNTPIPPTPLSPNATKSYGTHRLVQLTDAQYEFLMTNDKCKDINGVNNGYGLIERMDEYLFNNGFRYRSDFDGIMTQIARNGVPEKVVRPSSFPSNFRL